MHNNTIQNQTYGYNFLKKLIVTNRRSLPENWERKINKSVNVKAILKWSNYKSSSNPDWSIKKVALHLINGSIKSLISLPDWRSDLDFVLQWVDIYEDQGAIL